MRLFVKNLGPISEASLSFDKPVTLMIGPNKIGKTLISRCIYATSRSFVNGEFKIDLFASCLLDHLWANIDSLKYCISSNRDNFIIKIMGDDALFEAIFSEGKLTTRGGPLNVLAFYAPSYRTHFHIIKGLIFTTLYALTGMMKDVFDYDIKPQLTIFYRLYLLMKKGVLYWYLGSAFREWLPTSILDMILASLRIAFKHEEFDEYTKQLNVLNMWYEVPSGVVADIFAEVTIPIFITASGFQELYPQLLVIDTAIKYSKNTNSTIYIIIDEPEAHLDLINQIKYTRKLLDVLTSLASEGGDLRLIISTHSDIVVYSITRWLAEKGLTDKIRIYEFMDKEIVERSVDDVGEIYLKNISDALDILYWR